TPPSHPPPQGGRCRSVHVAPFQPQAPSSPPPLWGRPGGGSSPRGQFMLGRTAQNLFWLSRYNERAENMARLFEVGYRMSLTSRREGSASEHLVSMLQAAEVDAEFAKKHK